VLILLNLSEDRVLNLHRAWRQARAAEILAIVEKMGIIPLIMAHNINIKEKKMTKRKKTDSLKKGFFATLFGRGDGYCHIHSVPKEREMKQPKDKQEADKDPQKN
jgi:hypothetical protein